MSRASDPAAASGLPRPMTEDEKQAFLTMLGNNYRQLEFSIPDLRNATILLETMVEDTLSKPEDFHHMKRFEMTEDQWEGLSYAVRHVGDLARALSKSFYRGFEAPIDGSAQS